MVLNTLAIAADNESMMIDSRIIRADQHAAGDALGNPLRFFITSGQRSDDIKALDLIEGQAMSAFIADKGYDANYIVML